MKNLRVLFSALFILFMVIGYGQPIDEQIAKQAAVSKIKLLGQAGNCNIVSPPEVFSYQSGEGVLFYIFQIEPLGYIIVSGDMTLPPVIAYSFTNSHSTNDSEVNPLVGLVSKDLANRLVNADKIGLKTKDKINTQWNILLNDHSNATETILFEQWPPEGTTNTGGWLETNWSQGAPYNVFCPMDLITNQRSIAGCPSIAISMLLNYYKTLNGTEFNDETDDYYHSYAGRNFWVDDDFEERDFLPFPDINAYFDTISKSFINQTTLKTNERAALIWASGIAAKQVYTSNISGTFGVEQAHSAFLRFGYQDAVLLDGNDTTIHTRLAQNMMQARPALLAVIDPGVAGHNLVTDGYNTDGYYHLNFGWGGTYNGWYLIPDEIPYNLSVFEGVVVDIAYPQVFTKVDRQSTNPFSFIIFPNPASEKINIEFESNGNPDFNIELHSINGTVCYQRKITGLNLHQTIFSFTIDKEIAGVLSPGIYFVRINGGNHSATKKVVIH